MANMHKIMQNLARINADIDKFKSCANIDHKISSFMNNGNNTPQATNDLITYLKEEQGKLSSIGVHCNNSSKPLFHQHCTTPNKLNNFNKNRSKSKYSSSKKPRPRIRKTPLKPSNISNIVNIQNNMKNINNNNNNNKTKIPQKKLTFSISSSSNIPKLSKMDIVNDADDDNDNDNDFDSENDENIIPLNLMAANNKTMVEIKLEQNRKKNEKPKPKVDALQKAKLKRLEQERREKERKRQKDLTKKTIQENKRKKKLAQQQQQRQQQQATKKKYNHFTNSNNRRTLTMNNNVKNMPNVKKTKFKIQTNINHHNNNNNNKNQQNENRNSYKKLSNLIDHNNNNHINNNNNNNNNKCKQYPISDYDSDFSDSDLDEENCSKFIPVWARKTNPNQMIKRQKPIDPDTIFGRMIIKTCDLEILFKDYPSRTKYRQRSASGDWARDQISWTEENGYKKNMGWL